MIRTVLAVLTLLVGVPALACDSAEYLRLSGEQTRLAQRNAWTGVERAYRSLLKTRCDLSAEQHQLAAESARMLGKTLERTERLRLALEVAEPADAPELQRQLDVVAEAYGRVRIKGDPRRPPALSREVMPFAPDQQRAIEWARTELGETGGFDGLLPAGTYTVDETPLVVEAG
ncbi:MAG: hypothetical protein AAF211_19550, partial [Myxococcota bacterium]